MLLTENSKRSIRDLARILRLSPSTVAARVRRLEEMGVIRRYSLDVNFDILGYQFPVIIDIRVAKGMLMEVETEIAKHPNVVSVFDVTGEYDVTVIARFKTRSQLNDFIKMLQKMRYVERTNTKLILNIIAEDKIDGLIK
jgi:DNA-binding Lrp family transcriptional regulator